MTEDGNLATLFLSPIPGPAPAGVDITYEARFQELSAEAEKGSSLAGAMPDWARVLEVGTAILRRESKDLRVASWVVVAKANVDGWAGAAEGLAAYHALLDASWDAMHPPAKRARARAGLASWLWEGLALAFPSREVTARDAVHVRAVEGLVPRVDAVFERHLGEANPGAGVFRSVLRERVRDLPPPAASAPARVAVEAAAEEQPAARPETVTAPPAPRPAPPRAAAPSAPIPAPPTETIAPGTLDEAATAAFRLQDPIGTLARHVRQLAPSSPWSYRLARVGAWLPIEAPPALERERTTIRAPRPAEQAALARLFDAGDWAELRDQSEDALFEHIFWLDLHRYTAAALDNLGPTYAGARVALVRELAVFLARVPGLASLSFSNGTPFASPATAAWIATEQTNAGGSRAAAANHDADGPADELLRAARERVDAGDVDAAFADALIAARALTARPSRFRAMLGIARLASANGKTAIALALFEQLLPEVNDTLEAWAPTLCAEFFASYLQALRAAGADEGLAGRQPLLFRRLLALDPAAALRHGG